METVQLKPIDARGNQIYLGNRVRVVGVPDFSDVTPDSIRSERERIFKHVVGQCKKVDDIDQYGFIGLSFKIRKGQDAGIHCIWLEPSFVLVQQPNPSIKRDALKRAPYVKRLASP